MNTEELKKSTDSRYEAEANIKKMIFEYQEKNGFETFFDHLLDELESLKNEAIESFEFPLQSIISFIGSPVEVGYDSKEMNFIVKELDIYHENENTEVVSPSLVDALNELRIESIPKY